MKLKQEIEKLRNQIQALKGVLKVIGFRMGVLTTNTWLVEREILTLEEREWLLARYRDDVVATKIMLNQYRDRLEFNVLTYKLYRRRKES